MNSPLLLAESYLHRMDPVIFPVYGAFSVRWYGAAYLAGFIVAWLTMRWMAGTGRIAASKQAVGDLMMYVVIGVIAGGRLGYVLFYNPSAFITFHDSLPFWEVLAFNRGGMASHGGIIGVLIALILFARRHGIPALHVIDFTALVTPLGLCFGRIANLINGELRGKSLPDASQADPPWWSIKYPDEINNWSSEQLRELASAVETLGYSAREWTSMIDRMATDPAAREAIYGVGDAHGVLDRLVLAIQNGDEAVYSTMQSLSHHFTAYHPSQVIQAITDGPLLIMAMVLVWLKPRKPGIIAGVFLLAYGVMRLWTEYSYRAADDGVALFLGLQRGQLLSLPMVIAGIALIIVCARRDVPKMGGLLHPAPIPAKDE